LGANERTNRRDLADEGAANAAGDKITDKEIKGWASSPAAFAARIEFLRIVNAARGAESNAPVGVAEMQEALATVDVAAFHADPREAFERLRAMLHSIAFLWAAHAVDVGRFLRVAKADLSAADWAEMLNKRGDTEELAEAFMAEAETPFGDLAAAKIDNMLPDAATREHGKAHIAVAKLERLERLSQPQL
jgi:hypothetical protein